MSSHQIHDVDDWRPQVRVQVHGNQYEVTREDRRNGTEVVARKGWTPLVNLTEYVVACPWPHNGQSCGWCSI